MSHNTNKFRPTTNWMTTALLTLFVSTFGIFAQSHASERTVSLQDITERISRQAVDGISYCDTNVKKSQNVILYR
ncbi:MAG: hypothetical protein VB957_04995 [Pseudomonadales bacterium]